jgi:hypothetical protein
MYQKVLRPLDPYLALAALLPFEQEVPALEDATDEEIANLNVLWSAGLLKPEEIDRPPYVIRSGGDDLDHAKLRYEFFLEVRKCLRAITEAVAGDRPEGGELSRALPTYEIPAMAPLATRTFLLSGYGIRVYNEPLQIFLNCLELTGAEIWTLRPCPVCSTPFLPRRADQKTCSLNCSNTYRLRNYRAPDKDRPGRQKRPATPASWKGGEQL